MKVLKFGGTSVGTPQRMQEVSQLITADKEAKLVVLSAMSGTTNTLVEISDYLYKKNPEGANTLINRLEQKYLQHIQELYKTDEYKQQTEISRSRDQNRTGNVQQGTRDRFPDQIRKRNQPCGKADKISCFQLA